jgi:N-acetylmuramoyl-L-alanine amidase
MIQTLSKILAFQFLASSTAFCGLDFHDFDSYQERLTHDEVQKKIEVFLEKDPSIRDFYRLTPTALYIGDLKRKEVDYVLSITSSEVTKPASSYKGLKEAKIAIDPGHFGGSFAELEERFLSIPAEQSGVSQSPIFLREGDLTYLTALELKRLLEAEGATVLITRSGIGKGALEKNFYEWMKEKMPLFLEGVTLSKHFREFYNHEDLRARAEKINDFSPDIAIIIHYNAVPPSKGERYYASQNYNLAFVPGAFGRGELEEKRDRYEFLRLLVTQDLEDSVELSSKIVKKFAEVLQVPLIVENDSAPYLRSVCKAQKTGIYSRNLALTRLVHCPVCYGETLIQNHPDEASRLATQDFSIAGIPCSKRIQEVAQAYFEGIRDYFNSVSQ